MHLGCDLLIHSALLYYSGGSTNPFVLLLHGFRCHRRGNTARLYSIVLSGLALLGYTLMLVWYDPHPAAVRARHAAGLRHVAEPPWRRR